MIIENATIEINYNVPSGSWYVKKENNSTWLIIYCLGGIVRKLLHNDHTEETVRQHYGQLLAKEKK